MSESTYSLYSTDFELMREGMSGVPLVVRKAIVDAAERAYLDVSDYKEKQFWSAVAAGCSVH